MGIYSSLEDKWYAALDRVNSVVPVYKIVDPVDKVIPSFILFLIIIIGLILFLISFNLFSSNNNSSIDIIIISQNGIPLSNVEISFEDLCGENSLFTDDAGKVNTLVCGEEITLTANKKGYVKFNQVYLKEDYETDGRIAISLSQITQSERDFTALVTDEENNLIPSSKIELICSGEKKAEIANQSVDGFVFKIGQSAIGNVLDLYGQFTEGPAVSDCSNLQLRASADGYEDKIINVIDSDQRAVIKLKRLILKGTITFNSLQNFEELGGVEVNLTNSAGETLIFETDELGVYFEEFDVGVYNYSASYDGEFVGGTIDLKANKSELINLSFTSKQESTNDKYVNLQFVDSLDQAIVGASVSIFKNNLKLEKTTNALGQTSSLKVRESEITSTVFKGIVKASGYETKIFDIILQESTTHQKIVLSQSNGKLIVTVIDDLNNFEKNASVQLFLKDTNYLIDNARTDSNGQAIFTNLPVVQMDLLAQDYSGNDSKEINVTLAKDEEKKLLVQLDTGEGKIEFSILDKEGNLLVANYKLFAKVNGEFVLAKEGFGNKVLTDNLKVKTEVKLVVDDANYFTHQSLVYKINRGTQKKSIFVMKQNALPNANNVQMFLTQVYKTNPMYNSVNVADRFVDGEEYYLHFLVVLDKVTADKLVSSFVVDSNKGIYFGGANSVDGSYSVMSENNLGRFIDSASDSLVDDHAKQINTFVDAGEKVSVPVLVKLNIDENVIGSFKLKFNSFAGENSLQYEKEFVVGEKFCLQGTNCPVFMFSNFVKNKTTNETKPIDDRQVVFIEDEYSLLTKVHNLSDGDIGAVNVVFSIPATKLRYASFANDSNSQKKSIVLKPFGVSDFVEVDLSLKQNTTGLLISELVEDASGLSILKNYAGNNETINLSIKNKNVLAIDFSPGRIDVDSIYPMFLIKTRYNSSTNGVSAFWKAEKVVGSVKTLLYSGVTDGNGLSQISFNALNLDVGDVVLFTAWDSNGSIEGTNQVTVTNPFPSQVKVAPSCLGVWYDNSKIELDNFVVSSDVNGVRSFVIKSGCEKSVHVSFVSELSLSALGYDVNTGGQVTLSVTATPQNGVLGVYPVGVFSDEAGVSKLMNVDFIVKDPSSCFDLEQAIYDLKNTGEISSKVTNKCYEGRYNNFYPKMNLNTNSTYINFNKPGNPRFIDFNATVIGSGIEGYFQSTLGTTVVQFSQYDVCGQSDPDVSFTNLPATAASNIACLDVHQAVAQNHYYNGETVPKPEPDLNITNPRIALGRLPVPSDWASAPSMDSYEVNAGVSQQATQSGVKYNQEYPYIPVKGDFLQDGGIAGFGYLDEIDTKFGTNVFDFAVDGEDVTFDNTNEDGTRDTSKVITNEPFNITKYDLVYVGWPTYWMNNTSSEGRPSTGRVLPSGESVAFSKFNGTYYVTADGQKYDYASPERWYENAPIWASLLEEGSGCAKVIDVREGENKSVFIKDWKYMGSGLTYMQFRLHGAQSYFSSGSICHQNEAMLKLQFETTRGGEILFERKNKWSVPVTMDTTQGVVKDLGGYYDATPLPLLLDVTASPDGYGEWTGYPMEYVHYFTGAAHPNGFINLERSFKTNEGGANGCVVGDTECWNNVNWYSFTDNCANPNDVLCEAQRYMIRPPEDPLVEYDSTGSIMYYIPQDTIPGYVDGAPQVRTFLRDGKYYAEYVGVPQIAGKNIDFNLVKNNLIGDEYVLLEVSDWISDKETKSQKFRLKLSGQENLCVNDDGEEGYTGSDFVPRIDYDWSWQSVAIDECDSTNWQYNYCDGTQFTISLIKKLNEIENLLKAGHVTSVPAKTSFYVYLIKDNYNSSFLNDFRTYYLDSFTASETNYQKFFKFIEENKLKFSVDRKDETVLPFGGLFRVEIDLGQGNELLSSLFDGEKLNANIVVSLTPVRQAPNYNPLYEMPFDGLISNNGRDNYGLSLTGQDLVVKTGFVPLDYVGALSSFEVLTSTNSVELNKKLVLAVDKETKKIYFFPSQPTPVLMEITNNAFSNLVSGYKIENIVGSVNPSKEWRLIGSTMGGRVCNDFSGKSKTIFNDISMSGNINNLSWVDPDIGKILLATNFFTQKDSLTTTIVPTNTVNTKIKSFDYLNNSPKAFLNNYVASGVTDFDTLSWVLKGITTEKLCLSKNSGELMKVWWNQEYLNSLLVDVAKGEKTNCLNN
ncbi:MAG: hypothetical protein WC915_02215 [archaeon]